MALKHDAQGFLAGDAIDIGQALSAWGDIRNDVRAIRQAMLGKLQKSSEPAFRTIATPLGRDSRGRFIKRDPAVKAASSSSIVNNTHSNTLMPVQRNSGAAQSVVTPGQRDASGKFARGNEDAPGDAPGDSALRGFFDRLSGAVNGTANGLEEADPAVKAVQEIAQPLARGYQMITGSRDDKRKEGWFRKIYASLAGFRKDETAFSKAANKSLKNLEDKPVGGEGQAGFFGNLLAGVLGIGPFIMAAIAGLLAKIPGVGKIFSKAPVAAAAGVGAGAGVAGAAAKGAAPAADGMKGIAGKVLKKIPIIGALLALGMGVSEATATESDATTTRDEKNAKQGKTVGSVAGGLGGAAAGAVIGTLIFPGVGTVIGGVIGAVAGDWLGGNAGEIIGKNFKGITESMAAGWQSTTDTVSAAWAGVSAGFMVVSEVVGINWSAVGDAFKSVAAGIGKAWGDFVGLAKAGWDSFTGLFSAAYEGLKKIPIIGAGIQAAEDAATATAAAAKEVARKAVEAAKETAVKAATVVKDKAVEVADKTVAVAREAGAAAKTAYVEETNPGVGPSVPAPVGVVNRAAAAAGGAAGSVVRVGKNALAAGERASEMQKAVAGYTSDPKAQAMLMANMDHESAGFTRYDENLNYSSVDQIRKAFKGNKGITGMSDDQVQGLVKSPEKLANVVYADSNRGDSSKLGNTEAGDGYKFRGRGALQITGKSNYAEIGKRLGMGDALLKNPDMLANDPALAARASIEFLKMNKGRVDSALKSGDSTGLRKVINGGDNGLADVVSKTAKWDQKIQSGAASALPIATNQATVTAKAVVAPVAPAIAAPVQTAFAAAPKVPTFAPPPVISEAPPVINPLASSSDSKGSIKVTTPAQDVGQDVRDRRIAHIVTGGFSA